MFKGSPRSYQLQSKHYVIDDVTGYLSPEVIAVGKQVTIKKRSTSEQLTFTSTTEIEMLHYLLGMALEDARKE